MNRSVVITGLGAVTGLGVGAAPLWEGMLAGRSALGPITRFNALGMRSQLAAEIANLSAKDFLPKSYRKGVKVMARDIEIAVVAAKLAVVDAGLVTRAALEPAEDGTPSSQACTYPSDRMGCHIGAGLISADADELAAALVTAKAAASADSDGSHVDLAAWGHHGMDALTPLWLLKYLPNMLACHVTIVHGCCGPSNTITCAEASGLLSIGESVRVIERGQAELCFSGGAESKLNLMGMLRMDFAGRLAPTSADARGPDVVRPFDPDSAGGLLGEGGGIMILEEEAAALARGARAYARIVGVGGGHSPMRPVIPGLGGPAAPGAPTADEGFANAVENALADAGLRPDQLDAAVLMGSGVPSVDLGEALALRQLLGPALDRLPIVTVGPNVGNCAAGAGAIQVAVAAKMVAEQMLPARLNAGRPLAGVLAGAAPAGAASLRRVLVASSALGGQNAAIVLERLG